MAELSPEAMHLLNASRIAEPPSAQARHRIRAGIATATGAAVVTGAAASASAAVAGTAGASKVVIAAVVAGALGFGGGALVVHEIDARRGPAPVVSVAAPAPRALEAATAPDLVAPAGIEPAATPPVVQVPATTMHLPATASVARAEPPPEAEPGPAEDPGLAAELALIRAADDALAMHYPSRVITLADEHAASFPEGQLAQERESLRVLALCDLGRASDARAVAHAFFARWPGSPHAARLRASCARDD